MIIKVRQIWSQSYIESRAAGMDGKSKSHPSIWQPLSLEVRFKICCVCLSRMSEGEHLGWDWLRTSQERGASRPAGSPEVSARPHGRSPHSAGRWCPTVAAPWQYVWACWRSARSPLASAGHAPTEHLGSDSGTPLSSAVWSPLAVPAPTEQQRPVPRVGWKAGRQLRHEQRRGNTLRTFSRSSSLTAEGSDLEISYFYSRSYIKHEIKGYNRCAKWKNHRKVKLLEGGD